MGIGSPLGFEKVEGDMFL
ncbi:hypothetical protein CGLO_12551 [Colletotrichum gloeosporioides Cg-14]|uniref:Uncharacterized protein n=1 Tax=Colletotrichum gloeosporioides (strain Cg-14) TaxID=1237896 RepID=T0L9A4_COLGC|nr:hypothetical protein CGLO_12551 [Colletotrichum gloeosporioides Cg-14]